MSSREFSISNTTGRVTGWAGIAAIVLLYATLFVANYWLPTGYSNYTIRIWHWSRTALTLGAFLTLIVQRQLPSTRAVLLGLGLAISSALSRWLDTSSLSWSVQEGIAVWACFSAGMLLFKDSKAVSAFQLPWQNIGRSIALGILFAIPLTVINNFYFYMNAGTVRWQNVFYSAFEALSPAIHEEIVFRFFVLAFCLSLLKDITSTHWAMVLAVFLSVVPHSLNHLPNLFIENPIMGLAMLAATSLLFGLPMAILQIRKNLESAIAFHWFIDFARFFFGF